MASTFSQVGNLNTALPFSSCSLLVRGTSHPSHGIHPAVQVGASPAGRRSVEVTLHNASLLPATRITVDYSDGLFRFNCLYFGFLGRRG